MKTRTIIIAAWSMLTLSVLSQQVRSIETLSPEDLDMLKCSFSAKPNAEQVAVFQMDAIEDGKIKTKFTVSYSPLKDVNEGILLINHSFFDSKRGGEHTLKLRSWSFKLERMIRNEYKFVGEDGTGEIKFRGFGDKKGKESVFRFKMTLMPYKKAKEKWPELPARRGNDHWSWASKVKLMDLGVVHAANKGGLPEIESKKANKTQHHKSDRAGDWGG